ncbi:hypothetical protein AAG570_007312 [Ranatra chinensis]|uniref:G-protein coupled receptors family 1 profile domain-containing protein n=1 Tax=Ranatra chinensis TaxID=642074 RepID=A0ABD0XVI2_9HEMI
MLVAVVLMFAVCYFPVHFLSILRYTVDIPQNDTTAALSMMSHWLCYANSAVNPLIYNFMSGRYSVHYCINRYSILKKMHCGTTKNERTEPLFSSLVIGYHIFSR